MSGVVTGGWSFVIAAYAITAAALLIYGSLLVASVRKASR